MVHSDYLSGSESHSSASSTAAANGKDRSSKRSSKHRDSKKRSRDAVEDDTISPSKPNGTATRHPAERRSSVSKPARDFRDKPVEPPRKKKKSKSKRTAPTPDEEEEISVTRSPSPVIDFDGLSRPSLGTRERLEESEEQKQVRLERMKGAVRTILECVGEDPDREGILATPERYAKALLFFTKGYQQNVRDIVNGAIFNEGHNEMVCLNHKLVFTTSLSPPPLLFQFFCSNFLLF